MKKYRIASLCACLCLLLCSCNGNSGTASPVSETTAPSESSITSLTTVSETTVPSESSTTSLTATAAPTKTEPVSTTEIPFFLVDQTVEECDPIDKGLNCEEILLDRAESLQILMCDYLNFDRRNVVFEIGEEDENGYPVLSDWLKTYDDFKNLFSDKIYEGYLDRLCSWSPRLSEIDGRLYFIDSEGDAYIGTFETWYLGYEVTDEKIIGHFARLGGVEDIGLDDPEYLNDESKYSFYDITVQNIDGQYVLIDCKGDDPRDYYTLHGWCYNAGRADRSLITNEKVKPREVVYD